MNPAQDRTEAEIIENATNALGMLQNACDFSDIKQNLSKMEEVLKAYDVAVAKRRA